MNRAGNAAAAHLWEARLASIGLLREDSGLQLRCCQLGTCRGHSTAREGWCCINIQCSEGASKHQSTNTCRNARFAPVSSQISAPSERKGSCRCADTHVWDDLLAACIDSTSLADLQPQLILLVQRVAGSPTTETPALDTNGDTNLDSGKQLHADTEVCTEGHASGAQRPFFVRFVARRIVEALSASHNDVGSSSVYGKYGIQRTSACAAHMATSASTLVVLLVQLLN